MQIKKTKQNRQLLRKYFDINKISTYISIFIIIFIFLSGTFFGIIVYKDLKQKDAPETIKDILKAKLNIIPHFFYGLKASPEKLSINIKHLDYQKLAYNRKIALKRNQLFPDCRDEVPAEIEFRNMKYKSKIRLKGDFKDHWMDPEKWSFRIKIKGNNTIFNMKEFSIQLPRTRGYLNEWVFHKFLQFNDFISLRYDFINVYVNGKDLGIYALEEHFDKRLIEYNKRREGPIIKLSETGFNTAQINVFQNKKIETNEILKDNYISAVNLLEYYRQNKIDIEKVFDVKRLAELFAITDLFGHHHSTGIWNIRFYYNPIIAKLEPIGFDNQNIIPLNIERLYLENFYDIEGTKDIDFRNRIVKKAWFKKLFNDSIFVKEYIKALYKYSQKEILDSFFYMNKKEMNEKLNIIYKSFPWYSFDDKIKILYNNQIYITKKLNGNDKIQVYIKNYKNNKIALQIGNSSFLPMNIIGIIYDDSIIEPEKHIIINSQNRNTPIDFIECNFILREKVKDISNLKLLYSVYGLEKKYSVNINNFPIESNEFLQESIMINENNIKEFDCLKIDEKNKIIYFNKKVVINNNLYIPSEYTVCAEEGTKIDLINNAIIVSYSPFVFIGSKNNYIEVFSSDSSGSIIILENNNNIFDYVIFHNLSNPVKYKWQLTGGITFYEASVDFRNCLFKNNKRGDDLLNIIRSNFSMEECIFENSLSDAFDGDFVKGKISNSIFINAGNDAIDVSGSEINIIDTKIFNPGDKGISGGEQSILYCKNITIKNAEIAVSSKDLSEIYINDINIANSKIGYAVYQKKPEYGGGMCDVTNEIISNIEIHYMLEEKSILKIQNKNIKPNYKNVKKHLYGKEYGKSSK